MTDTELEDTREAKLVVTYTAKVSIEVPFDKEHYGERTLHEAIEYEKHHLDSSGQLDALTEAIKAGSGDVSQSVHVDVLWDHVRYCVQSAI